mmetsp:Transcript_42081/g.134423  ORF Transcript_42081/g.134423 Transcript_42081/m.134423 type:complete len:103 (-) Transcript_42081:295-603(-)
MSNWQSQMERSACLSYDYGHSLEPKDLDAICVFGKMVTTRAGGMTISHKDALDLCVRHAMSIYTGGETPLLPETDLTCECRGSCRFGSAKRAVGCGGQGSSR